jgi:hypothetical protein
MLANAKWRTISWRTGESSVTEWSAARRCLKDIKPSPAFLNFPAHHRGLLGARRERPCGCRAAENRDA